LVYGNNVPKEQQQLVEISTSYGVMVVKLYNETPLHRDNFIKLVRQGFYDSLLFHRIIKSFMIQGGDPLSKHADSNAMLGSGDNGNKIPPEFNAELFHKRGALAAARDNNPQKMSSGCQFYIVQGRRYSAQELEQIINSRNLARKQELLYQCYQSDSVQATVSAFQNMGDKEQTRLYMERIQLAVDKMYKEMYPDATVINENQVQTYIEYGGAPHLDGSYTVFGELVSGWDVLDKIAMVQTKPGDRPAVDVRMKMRLL
jgi:cyclophilin family peptidyl-prolyl cis-trans isomerase